MALKQFTKYVPEVGIGTVIDFAMPNGGILLSIDLQWVPFTYYNKDLSTQVATQGDLQALISDTTTARSIIGQIQVSPADVIVVPTESSWDWEHPNSADLSSSYIIHKMRAHSAFPLQPDGVLVGNLRVLITQDPQTLVTHGVLVTAKVISFDTNLS